MTPLAAEIWDELAPLAIEMGTLTSADAVAFATLCELEASRWIVVQAKSAADFVALKVGRDYKGNETTIEASVFESERVAVEALIPWLQKFGLEPAGLGRVVKPSAGKPSPAGAVDAPKPKADVRDFAARARERLKVAGRAK